MEKFETVYYDSARFRYVIDLDLLDLNPDTGTVKVSDIIRVLQDYRNSWSHLRTFTKAKSTTILFKLAYVDIVAMSRYAAFINYLQTRIVVDLFSRLVYFYADGKVPASETDAKEYCGPSIYNPIPEFTVTKPDPINPFSRILIDYPTDRILAVSVSTDVGVFEAPFIISPTGEKKIAFSGGVETINSELQKVTFAPGEDTANIIIAVDDGVGITGSVSSTTVRVSGHNEPLTPTMKLTPSLTNIAADMEKITLSDFIYFSGKLEDITSLTVSTSVNDLELETAVGTIPVTASAPVVLTGEEVGNLSDVTMSVLRAGDDENSTTVIMEVTLTEAHESEILTASFDVTQEEIPEPGVNLVKDSILLAAGETSVTLTDYVDVTGVTEEMILDLTLTSQSFNVKVYVDDGVLQTVYSFASRWVDAGIAMQMFEYNTVVVERTGDTAISGYLNFALRFKPESGLADKELRINIEREANA